MTTQLRSRQHKMKQCCERSSRRLKTQAEIIIAIVLSLAAVQMKAQAVHTVTAGDDSITVGGSSRNITISVAPSGITNAHIADGALNPAKITGTAATLGSNEFAGTQTITTDQSTYGIMVNQSNHGSGVGQAVYNWGNMADGMEVYCMAGDGTDCYGLVASGTQRGVLASGVYGVTALADNGGTAVQAWGGTGIGVDASGGIAGQFTTNSGGSILTGKGPAGTVFRVDADGNVFSAGFIVGGADFAESVETSGEKENYHPGDVVVIDPTARRRVGLSRTPYSTTVAGIYSTRPGVVASSYLMNDPRLAREIPLAVVGIVPCHVSAENGAIGAGDLLVTSATPGYAMKGTDRSRMIGAVLGKALEPLPSGKGVIQVLVTLQ